MRERILAFSVQRFEELTSNQLSFPVLEGSYSSDSTKPLTTPDQDIENIETTNDEYRYIDYSEDEEDDEEQEDDEELLILDEPEAQNLAKHPTTESMAIVHTSATDYHSAVSRSISTVESIFNYYQLFSHKAHLKIAPFAVAEQACCEKVFKRIDHPENAMHFIRDMRSVKASSTMKRFSERIMLDVGPDEKRFQNLINIHGMSLSSTSDDIQLVNLWTCLETMTPASSEASKVGSVVSSVTPVIVLNYYNRIVSNLLFDILRWNRRSTLNIIRKIPSFQTDDLKANFSALLSSDKNDEILDELLASFGDYELLRYRVFDIASILRDREAAIDKLNQHEKLVTWQLHRIYRTRNSIVHSGESPSFTPLLVENAHDFFDQGLMFCLEVSAWKPGFDSFVACFDYAKAQAAEYRKLLGDPDRNLIWTLPKHNGRSFIFDDGD